MYGILGCIACVDIQCITCVADKCVIHMFYTCNTYVGYTPLSYDYCWDCNLIGWFQVNTKLYVMLSQLWRHYKSVSNAFTAISHFAHKWNEFIVRIKLVFKINFYDKINTLKQNECVCIVYVEIIAYGYQSKLWSSHLFNQVG